MLSVPVLPIFDEDEDPENTTPFGVTAGRIAVFVISVRIARYLKEKVWSEELSPIRHLWSNSADDHCGLSVLAGFCVLLNILLSSCVGIRFLSMYLKQPLPSLCTANSIWVLLALSVVAQLVAIATKAPPVTYEGLEALIRMMPASGIKFALRLDVLGLICVAPVFASMLYCGIRDMVGVTTAKIALAMLVSTTAVLAPSMRSNRSADRSREHGILSRATVAPDRPGQSFMVDPITGSPFIPSSREPSRIPTLIISSEGCSPAILNRIRQIEAQQEEIRNQILMRKSLNLEDNKGT